MTTRFPYDPPIRGHHAVTCMHCGLELAATAHVVEQMEIIGLRGYEWVHVATNDARCRLEPPLGRPYDGWNATREIEAGLRERYAAEDAALDATEPA